MSLTRKKETQIYKYEDSFTSVGGRFPKSIIAKVDWYTIMFYDTSVEKVLDFYGLNNFLSNDLLSIYSDRYSQDSNIGKVIVLSICPGVRIEIMVNAIIHRLKIYNPEGLSFEELMCEDLPSIRFDFSGSGLEFLRAGGYDVEYKFTRPTFVFAPSGEIVTQFGDIKCKITRIDIAFDLLNWDSSFYDHSVDLLVKYGDGKTGSVHLGESTKKCNKTTYSIHSGYNRTIYLGSASSDRLCRIYDKMFQWEQAKRKSLSDLPYVCSDGTLPESWVRIELQLRDRGGRAAPEQLLHFAMGDFSKMFSYYYHHYAICSEKGRVAIEFASFFDWNEIPIIMQNANYKHAVVTKEEQLDRDLVRIASPLFNLCAHYGIEGAIYNFLNYIALLEASDNLLDIRRLSFIKQRSLNDDNSLPKFIEVVNGRWQFKS